MKDWEYYSTPKAEYFSFSEVKNEIKKHIDATPMTAEERKNAISDMGASARRVIDEKNRPYNEEKAALDAEFWRDAREEIGYGESLNEAQISVLENKAWEDGHSAGYSEVFIQLQDLVDFLDEINRVAH